MIQSLIIWFCNAFVFPLWVAIVYLLERQLREFKAQKSPTEHHWLRQAHLQSDAWAMREAKTFLLSLCSLIQQTQSQCTQAWLILTASIQLQSSFSSPNFFSCYFADKIAQIWTELSTAMETEQYSQEINTASPLLVLRSCLPKLEVLLQISAMPRKLEPFFYQTGESQTGNTRSIAGSIISISSSEARCQWALNSCARSCWGRRSWQKQPN